MKNSNKTIISIIIVIIVLVVIYLLVKKPTQLIQANNNTQLAGQKVDLSGAKNATYKIDGQDVTLKDGVSVVEAAPGSASKITTTYFGNEVVKDLNGDGRPDVAFLITQNSGGSGTFFYVVAALNTPTGYVGSDAYLLGDRISPQTTESGTGNIVVVNYMDRAPSDPMTTQPSVGKTVQLLLDTNTMQWGVVANDFEGEADPNTMTLGMKSWTWVTTNYSNDKTVTPIKSKTFTIAFKNDGTFAATTDCNSIAGKYSVDGQKINFSDTLSTLMFCQGSQEGDFSKMLDQVDSYSFNSKGQLILDLKLDSGSAIFQ